MGNHLRDPPNIAYNATNVKIYLEGRPMTIKLRPGTPADAGACGVICHAAFHAVCTRHGFPPDFPSAQVAGATMAGLLGHPGFYSVVAEQDGRIVGSNFLYALVFSSVQRSVSPRSHWLSMVGGIFRSGNSSRESTRTTPAGFVSC